MLFMFQTKKYLSFIPLRRKMITIFIISIIPTAILLYLKNILPLTISSIIILSALFVLIYGTLLIISKSLDENDWMIIRAVWRKIVNF